MREKNMNKKCANLRQVLLARLGAEAAAQLLAPRAAAADGFAHLGGALFGAALGFFALSIER